MPGAARHWEYRWEKPQIPLKRGDVPVVTCSLSFGRNIIGSFLPHLIHVTLLLISLRLTLFTYIKVSYYNTQFIWPIMLKILKGHFPPVLLV